MLMIVQQIDSVSLTQVCSTPRVLHISAAVGTFESPSILQAPVVQQYNVKFRNKKNQELVIRVRMSECQQVEI